MVHYCPWCEQGFMDIAGLHASQTNRSVNMTSMITARGRKKSPLGIACYCIGSIKTETALLFVSWCLVNKVHATRARNGEFEFYWAV